MSTTKFALVFKTRFRNFSPNQHKKLVGNFQFLHAEYNVLYLGPIFSQLLGRVIVLDYVLIYFPDQLNVGVMKYYYRKSKFSGKKAHPYTRVHPSVTRTFDCVQISLCPVEHGDSFEASHRAS